jgi:hypothetical protein
MANRERDDAVRSGRRRNTVEIGSDRDSATRRGNIDGERRPTLEELRTLRADIYNGDLTRRRSVPAPRMVSAAVSRSSLSPSKSTSSKNRVKRSTSRRSGKDGSPHKRKTVGSKDDDTSQVYVYGPPRERRSSRIESETRRLGRDDESCDSSDDAAALPVISEEPGQKLNSRKVKVVYVDDEGRRLSRHGSRKVDVGDGTSSNSKAKISERSLHRSDTTPSRRNSTILPPLETLKRYVS